VMLEIVVEVAGTVCGAGFEFVTIPKINGTPNCEDHRTDAAISHYPLRLHNDPQSLGLLQLSPVRHVGCEPEQAAE